MNITSRITQDLPFPFDDKVRTKSLLVILLFEIYKHAHSLQGNNTNIHILTFQTLSILSVSSLYINFTNTVELL